MNRRGLRTEPCGTPDSTSPMTDFDSPTLTRCVRLCRKDATLCQNYAINSKRVLQSSNKDSGIHCIKCQHQRTGSKIIQHLTCHHTLNHLRHYMRLFKYRPKVFTRYCQCCFYRLLPTARSCSTGYCMILQHDSLVRYPLANPKTVYGN